jgi:hypothetical protein
MVVTYRDAAGRAVTHRVARVVDGGYEMKGDANGSADPGRMADRDVIGVGRLVIPYVGRPFAWARAAQPLTVAAWALLTGVAVLLALARPARRDQRRRAPVRPAVVAPVAP